MRKTLASLFLGAVLLAPCGAALAESPRPVEPRWGIRPEKRSPTLLDFARWLSEKFGSVVLPAESEPTPSTDPVPGPYTDLDPDIVCLDREHCPIG